MVPQSLSPRNSNAQAIREEAFLMAATLNDLNKESIKAVAENLSEETKAWLCEALKKKQISVYQGAKTQV